MAQGAKVLKVKLDISDTDRGCYQSVERSLVLHPSESTERLLARLIAFGLEYEDDLAFGRGLSHTDEAPIWALDPDNRVRHWIDIGQPDAERFSKLYRRCERLSLYCYGATAENWWSQHHKAFSKLQRLRVYRIPWDVLAAMSPSVRNGFSLQLVRNENHLYLGLGEQSFESELMVLMDGTADK